MENARQAPGKKGLTNFLWYAIILSLIHIYMDEDISGSNLIFKINLPNDPVMIRGDGERLYRVFQNVIKNSLQYSLEGSRVYISLYPVSYTHLRRRLHKIVMLGSGAGPKFTRVCR